MGSSLIASSLIAAWLLLWTAVVLPVTPVKVWEEKLVIPKYPARMASIFPSFQEFDNGRPLYPYPPLETDDFRTIDKSTGAIYLENEYLKVAVLPEIGGRIYSVFDKIANREVLAAPAGIQWRFPDAASVLPVDYTIRLDRDGSGEVVVGETERVQGLQWQAAIRLRPGLRAVEVEVTLHNPTAIPGRYWYWAAAAMPPADDTRFVQRDDHTGLYYEKSDWGLVHVADRRILPGRQTSTDAAAALFQVGRSEQRSTHTFLAPNHADRFIEYWFPVNHLSGAWSEATRDGALRLRRDPGKAQFAVDMNRVTANADITLEDDAGKTIKSWKTTLKPGEPFAGETEAAGSGPVTLRVRSGEKEAVKEWLVYRSQEFPESLFEPKKAVENAYDIAVQEDKDSDDRLARENYKLAANQQAMYAAARLALGISYLRTAEYSTAEGYLRDVVRVAPERPDAHYYLGFALRASGKLVEAGDHLTFASASGEFGESARQALGEMFIASGLWPAAIEQLSLSTAPKARALLALATRASGNSARARVLITQLRQELPLDCLVLHEATLLGEKDAEKELWRLLDRDPDAVLGLSYEYAALKRVEARMVLEKAIARAGQNGNAMWYYALGQFAEGARASSAYVFPHRGAEIETLRRALAALPPNSPGAGRTAYYLGDALAGQHRLTEAVAQWRTASLSDTGNAAAFYNLSRASLAAENFTDAATELDRAVAAAPNEYRLYLLRDDVLIKLKATQVRRTALLDAAPDSVKGHWQVALRLAPAYIAGGRLEDGAALLEKVSFPPNAVGEAADAYRRAELEMAAQFTKAGRHSEAAAALAKSVAPPGATRATEAATARPKVMMDIADSLERGRKHDEAQAWVERAAAWPGKTPVSPASITVEDNYYRALALAKLRRFEDAKVFMQRAAEGDPENPLSRDAMLTLRHWKSAGAIQ